MPTRGLSRTPSKSKVERLTALVVNFAEVTCNVKKLANLSLNRYLYLEPLLIAIVFSVTALMWYYSIGTPVLLHLFYVPVVLTGSLLGCYRARVMSLLCILTSLIIFVPHLRQESLTGIPLMTLSVFMLWASTLVLIAMIVGTLSDGRRSAMAELTAAHKKDVLTDSLTGIANRRAYEFELARHIAKWNRDKTPLSLVLLDIDYFKKFNDRHGHQAGDAVLKAVANVLKETVRETDLVARYGGEEFGLILSGISVEETKVFSERIRALIESARFPFNGLILRLTVSAGFAQIRPDEDSTSFMQRADAALYSSKEAGRNCVHFHNGSTCQQFGVGIAMELTESLRKTKSIQILSDPYTDETTGLPTQKVFLEELRRRTAERNRYGTKLSLALVQFVETLDDSVQDTHARKSLLATFAKLASSALRDTDLIARFDSSRFGILLPVTDLEGTLNPLRRLHENANKYTDAKYSSLSYAVSIGVVEVSTDEHPGAALRRVETTLEAATDNGGNRIYLDAGNGDVKLDNAEFDNAPNVPGGLGISVVPHVEA